MNNNLSIPTTRAALLAATVLFVAGCSQGTAPGGSALADSSSPGIRPEVTIAQTLRDRPEFSDFRSIVTQAGLWESLGTSHNLTVLVPTNAAFERSDPSWRTNTQAQYSVQGSNTDLLKRQALIQTSQIEGVHPPSDFVGKLQDVRTIGGETIHVDGMTPGVIKITSGPAMVSQFGVYPNRASATMQTPPLRATNGLIYSLDSVPVKDTN